MKTLKDILKEDKLDKGEIAISELKDYMDALDSTFFGERGDIKVEKDVLKFTQSNPLGNGIPLDKKIIDLIYKVYSLNGCNLIQFEAWNGVYIRNENNKSKVYDFKKMNIELLCEMCVQARGTIKNMNIQGDQHTITFENEYVGIRDIKLENVNINCKSININDRTVHTNRCNLKCDDVIIRYKDAPSMYVPISQQVSAEQIKMYAEKFMENKLDWMKLKEWVLKKLKIFVNISDCGGTCKATFTQKGGHWNFTKLKTREQTYTASQLADEIVSWGYLPTPEYRDYNFRSRMP